MRNIESTTRLVACIYMRLSKEDGTEGESGSITNQRKILTDYCEKNNILVVKEFVDDDYSGGNFNRPGFQEMLRFLNDNKFINTVITKDLSRLGRDMAESSYYAERYFPEHKIRFIAIYDDFDSDKDDNMLAPFMFAINDVYLRDSSKKVKTALHTMMEHGEYCSAAPYGYDKDVDDIHKLIPNPDTAPVVRQIFSLASQGYSTWLIADTLTANGIYPPLKYKYLYKEKSSSGNANKISDVWCSTTVKRILKNQVYLGHTMLGKSKKVSPKSPVKVARPKSEWHITENTHEALVSESEFELANKYLGKRSRNYSKYDHVRKSVFGGLVYCSKCGAAMCSCGSVYNGEREKYWYLACQNIPSRSKEQCKGGARIKYSDFYDAILNDLNELIALSDEEKKAITLEAVKRTESNDTTGKTKSRIAEINARIEQLGGITGQIYEDIISSKVSREMGDKLIAKYSAEEASLKEELIKLNTSLDENDTTEKNYARFFALTESVTHIKELTPSILNMFIERIDVEPKIPGEKCQNVHVYYKFIGEID